MNKKEATLSKGNQPNQKASKKGKIPLSSFLQYNLIIDKKAEKKAEKLEKKKETRAEKIAKDRKSLH